MEKSTLDRFRKLQITIVIQVKNIFFFLQMSDQSATF